MKRPKPIVEIRALDYRWVELASPLVPGSIEAQAKAAWRLQFRREGEVEWSPISVVVINTPPPDDLEEDVRKIEN